MCEPMISGSAGASLASWVVSPAVGGFFTYLPIQAPDVAALRGFLLSSSFHLWAEALRSARGLFRVRLMKGSHVDDFGEAVLDRLTDLLGDE
jgi:hypothetical protein